MKKLLIGGIVGGILYFFLGYLFYGNLLNQYFKDHPGNVTGVDRAMDQFQWWALILGNLLSGFLIAYIFSKSAVVSLASGLVVGGTVGFLMSCSHDLIMYATTNLTSKHAMLVDVATFTVMSAIVGAVVGAIMGMGSKRTVPSSIV
jgi:integral membrane sensor domain MASE1